MNSRCSPSRDRALSTCSGNSPGRIFECPAYYHFLRHEVAGVHMIISRTGYTGELGFELYFPSDVRTAEKIWNALMEAGATYGIGPVGLGARDTLRLEMGFCLYGHDIDQTTNPIEAGLGWITKLEKGDSSGESPILKAKQGGTQAKARRVCPERQSVSAAGLPDPCRGKRRRAQSPPARFLRCSSRGIGMGYVETPLAKPGTAIGGLHPGPRGAGNGGSAPIHPKK